MAIVSKGVLEGFFTKGAKPTAAQFATLINSMLNLSDDSDLLGLSNYNPIFVYVAGNTVVNNNGIYQANTQTTPGPFNASDWNLIAGGTPGYLIYRGLWNALKNTPDLTKIPVNQGDFYVVSVSGNTNLSGITDWQVNDWAIFNGTDWQKIDNSDLVTDAENIGPGTGVYKGKDTTTLLFKTLTNIDGSVNINNGSASIDFSVHFDDASVSPSVSWSSYKINNELTGKEPANPNIQAHIADMSNPHNTTQAQVGLSNVDNTSDINKPVSTAQAAADTVVLTTAKSYADSLVVGLLDDRGNYDASVNLFPSTGGSGTGGVILKGDLWTVSVAGTLGGIVVVVGDMVRALADAPGQTSSNWAVTQNNLGYVAENSANKVSVFQPIPDNIHYPTEKLVADQLNGVLVSAKSYADSLVVGLLDDRGNYNASGNVFPDAGGSGPGGVINKGDLWTLSAGGTLGGQTVVIGDVIRALVDIPGQTPAKWAITQNNLGYIPENSANKDTDSTMAANSDIKYPSQKAVKTALATKEPTITGTGNITDFWSGAKTFRNLPGDVFAFLLTGYTLGANAVISATDTILTAFGKLQKQISDHIANTANPHLVTKAQVGLPDVLNIKVNYTAIVDPVVGNDNTQGYAVGSTWINTVTGKEYVCVNAATGAASWKETTPASSGVFGNDYYMIVSQVSAVTGVITPSFANYSPTVPLPGGGSGPYKLSTGTRNGTYRIQWSCLISTTTRAGQFQIKNITSGTPQIVALIEIEGKNTSDVVPISWTGLVTLTGVNQDFVIQYNTVHSGGETTIVESYMEIFRVS